MRCWTGRGGYRRSRTDRCDRRLGSSHSRFTGSRRAIASLQGGVSHDPVPSSISQHLNTLSRNRAPAFVLDACRKDPVISIQHFLVPSPFVNRAKRAIFTAAKAQAAADWMYARQDSADRPAAAKQAQAV